MLYFAVPGTVVGIAYILAFNTPPIELAYTGIISSLLRIPRHDDQPARRARVARARSTQPRRGVGDAARRLVPTVRRVVLPLIGRRSSRRLVYSFISAMTSISAVIFLTSPRFDMATVNIVGRAEVGEYGYATAYASVLIVLMVLAVVLIRVLVGKRQMSRRHAAAI